MAQPASTFSSYDAVGNREDLADFIYMVEQKKTPFTSAISKVEATNTTHEWQTDTLAAAAENYVIEGDDATTDASAATTRLSNYTGISDKVARVTGTQRQLDAAGRADEMDYQVAKRGMELRRDVEKMALDNNAKVLGNDTTAREVAGVPSWIATNTSAGVGGADPTGNGTDARTDGTQRALAESDVKTVLAACADQGGEPDMIMVGSFNKQAFSAFSGNATRTTDATRQALDTAVHIYTSDFGEVEVVYSPFQRARDLLIIDSNLWALATIPGRNYASWDLAKTGDTDRKQVLIEWTLESRNEAGSGGVFDLTTA